MHEIDVNRYTLKGVELPSTLVRIQYWLSRSDVLEIAYPQGGCGDVSASTLACARLSINGDERKSGRALSLPSPHAFFALVCFVDSLFRPISLPEAAFLLVSTKRGISIPLTVNARRLWGRDCFQTILEPGTGYEHLRNIGNRSLGLPLAGHFNSTNRSLHDIKFMV